MLLPPLRALSECHMQHPTVPAGSPLTSVLTIRRVRTARVAAANMLQASRSAVPRTLSNTPPTHAHRRRAMPTADFIRVWADTPNTAAVEMRAKAGPTPALPIRGGTECLAAAGPGVEPTIRLSDADDAALAKVYADLLAAWDDFTMALIAHCVSELDSTWTPEARRLYPHAVAATLRGTPPAELPGFPVFARFLNRPASLAPLRPALRGWVDAHARIALQRIETPASCTEVQAYRRAMAGLLAGNFTEAVRTATLGELFNALHSCQVGSGPHD